MTFDDLQTIHYLLENRLIVLNMAIYNIAEKNNCVNTGTEQSPVYCMNGCVTERKKMLVTVLNEYQHERKSVERALNHLNEQDFR